MTTDRDELLAAMRVHAMRSWTAGVGSICACGWEGINLVAHTVDELLAAGWQLTDPTAETRTEWGVRATDGVVTRLNEVDIDETVRNWAAQGLDLTAVCRTATTTAWTTPEEAS